MNKYVIFYCDLVSTKNDYKTFISQSIPDCREQIIQFFSDYYDIPDCDDYYDFLDKMDKDHNIAISEIIDVETL